MRKMRLRLGKACWIDGLNISICPPLLVKSTRADSRISGPSRRVDNRSWFPSPVQEESQPARLCVPNGKVGSSVPGS